MEKLKTLLGIIGIVSFFSVSFAYSTEEIQAYNYAYQNSITTMTSIGQADMGGNLTRIAMAKMLSNYAINILGLLPDTSKNCYFSDVSNSLDAQYDNGVTRACQLGLMGVGINQFYPNSQVTRAEFGTVLSRALNAKNTSRLAQMNSAEPYYYEHLRYLQGELIMNNISNPDSLELRGRVMLMLMRSDKNYVPEDIESPTTYTYSANKIDTRNIYTEGCDWTTRTLNRANNYENMPNKNWTDDIKFVNKALQDVRDNGEHLVQNYIDEANRILDSVGLTKRDQCRYSLLIDELERQNGIIKSYKTENGKVTIGVDFISYKENITWDDALEWGYDGRRDLKKNTSTKLRYYTVSDNAELETVNVDSNGVLFEGYGTSYTKFINERDTRLNNFCNNEPIYYHIDDNELQYIDYRSIGTYFNGNWYYNHNGGNKDRYCIKRQIESGGTEATLSFDNKGQVNKIKKTYYFDCPWCS